jgi:SAM-dependent methyltransferase
VLQRRDQDVAFWLEVARQAGGPVLELACGTGRLTHALADAGTAVVGLDNDPVMLSAASAANAGRHRGWPIFIAGDMRRFALNCRFGLVFVGYNSLQLLTDPRDMTACLRLAREHLAPGGRVGLEVTDFQTGGADGPDDRAEQPPERLGDAEGIRLTGTLVHDLEERTSCYRRHFSGDGWTVDNQIVVRSLDRPELEILLREAGLTAVKYWTSGASGTTLRALAVPYQP